MAIYFYKRRTGRQISFTAQGDFHLENRFYGISNAGIPGLYKRSKLRFVWNEFRLCGDPSDSGEFMYAGPIAGVHQDPGSVCDDDIFESLGYVGIQGCIIGPADAGAPFTLLHDEFYIPDRELIYKYDCDSHQNVTYTKDLECSGDYEINVVLEEWGLYYATLPDDADEDLIPLNNVAGFPKYAYHPNGEFPQVPFIEGTPAYFPYARRARWFETKPGAPFSASINIDDQSLSISGTQIGGVVYSLKAPEIDLPGATAVRFLPDDDFESAPAITVSFSCTLDSSGCNYTKPGGGNYSDFAITLSGDGDSVTFTMNSMDHTDFLNLATFYDFRLTGYAAPNFTPSIKGRFTKQDAALYGKDVTYHGSWTGMEYLGSDPQNDPAYPYPQTHLHTELTASGGNVDVAPTLQQCSLTVAYGYHENDLGKYWDSLFPNLAGWSIDKHVPIFVYLDSKEMNQYFSLSGEGFLHKERQDINAWRVFMEDPDFETLATLTPNSPHVVDNMNSSTGWIAGTNSTVSSDGSSVSVAASGGTGSMRKVFDDNFRNFRYGRAVSCFMSVAGEITVKIKSRFYDTDLADYTTHDKTFTVSVGASPATIPIDLCVPKPSMGMAFDHTDDPFSHLLNPPYTPEEDNDPPVVPGDIYGVGNVIEIEIGGVPDGATLTIGALELYRAVGSQEALVSALQVYHNFQKWADYPDPEVWGNLDRPEGATQFDFEINGKQATPLINALFFEGFYYNTYFLTIHEALARFSAVIADAGAPGFTVSSEKTVDNHTDIGALRNPTAGIRYKESAFYNTIDLPAFCTKLVRRNSSHNYVGSINDWDITAGFNLVRCLYADWLEASWITGDPMQALGPSNRVFPVRFEHIISPGYKGFLCDKDTRAPTANLKARVIDSQSAQVEALVSGNWGRYKGTKIAPAEVVTIETTESAASVPLINKRHRRTSLLAKPEDDQGDNPTIAFHEKTRLGYIVYERDNRLQMIRSNDYFKSSETFSIPASDKYRLPYLILASESDDDRLLLLIRSDQIGSENQLLQLTNAQNGKGQWKIMPIASGVADKRSCIIYIKERRITVYIYASGGATYCKRSGDRGATFLEAPIQIVNAEVAIHAIYDDEPQEILGTYVKDGTVYNVRSADDGKNWKIT